MSRGRPKRIGCWVSICMLACFVTRQGCSAFGLASMHQVSTRRDTSTAQPWTIRQIARIGNEATRTSHQHQTLARHGLLMAALRSPPVPSRILMERRPNKNGGLGYLIRRATTGFSYGASYVHDNFLSISWLLVKRILIGQAIMQVAVLAVYFAPSYPGLRSLTGALTEGSALITKTSLYYTRACNEIIAAPISMLGAYYFTVFLLPLLAGMKKLYMTGDESAIGVAKSMHWIMDTLVFRSVGFLTITLPVGAEIRFRYIFTTIKNKLGFGPGKVLWFGYPPSVVISSLLFAGSQLANWYTAANPFVLPIRPETLDESSRLLFTAMQFSMALFLSLDVLSPVYLKGGLAAAIGAHLFWNLSMFMQPLGLYLLIIRILVAGLRDVIE